MDHVVHPLLLFFFFFFTIYITVSSAADLLRNPDFEIPPPNVTENGSRVSSIPGWSISGTVWYVAWGNSSTPAGGGTHALQLGPNGKINQTLKASGASDALSHYVLSFTVAAHNQDCANNRTALKLTRREQDSSLAVFRVVHLQQNSSRNLWERHAFFLGMLAGGEHVHIEIESIATNSCWPLVDAFFVKKNPLPIWENGISNAGFEVGPAFLNNSQDGIIMNEELAKWESPLQEWSILGTVRYIDSRHFKVPRGRAAVELLSGDPSGVMKELVYFPSPAPSRYTFNFTLGDANDSCVGNFMVHVQVGASVYNFTMQSNGTGSAFRHSLTFKTSPSAKNTSLSINSFDETKTRDGLLCGPVVDDIFLDVSHGERMNAALVLSLFIAFVMLIVL